MKFVLAFYLLIGFAIAGKICATRLVECSSAKISNSDVAAAALLWPAGLFAALSMPKDFQFPARKCD